MLDSVILFAGLQGLEGTAGGTLQGEPVPEIRPQNLKSILGDRELFDTDSANDPAHI
jgi:hypothetical protein